MKIEIKIGDIQTIPSSDTIAEAVGRGVSNLIYSHLLEKNAKTKTREGWTKSNYYAEAAQSVSSDVAGAGQAVVRIVKEGVALHYFGGVIRPTKAKALAIPLRPEVAEVWPSEYTGKIFKVKKTNGRALLAIKEGKSIKVLWLLTKSVSIKADRTILPEKEEIIKCIER